MKKIILNQKSYLLYEEEVSYIKNLKELDNKKFDFIIFPPILYLTLFKNSKFSIGSQNFYSKKTGSFTGEVNLESLKDIGVEYTLIGNYERRKFLNESFDESKEKLFRSLNSKFNTLLCVGENKKTSRPFIFIKREINSYLKSIEKTNLKYLSIIYEPNWAIGNGEIDDVNKIKNVVDRIKTYIKNKYNINLDVYYGGSVDKYNINEILNICDGIVLGKQCVDINELNKLLKEVE